MKKKLFIFLFTGSLTGMAQTPEIDSWILNTTGKYASYWENTATSGPPTYVFHSTTDSADIIKLCYDASDVYVYCQGMTNDMGQFLNPGTCEPMGYVYRIPRTPVVPTSKTESPKVGAIGVLTNGIPIYGLTNSYSWNGTINTNMGGLGIWNVEVYLAEGFVLDTAFGAHPQQAGAYHTHATPWRLYKDYPSTQHSPIIGFAFDGYPVYGPYGYSSPMDASSGISRMKTGYSLRSITVRQTLPDGTVLSSGQYGPSVSTTYPLGTYMEDYEWLAANGGDLDEYNGRFCVTPEYPSGTYAYFVAQDASGNPEYPYYIGPEYYGDPDDGNITVGGSTSTGIIIPSTTTCVVTGVDEMNALTQLTVYPNPNNGEFKLIADNNSGDLSTVELYNSLGVKIKSIPIQKGINTILLSNAYASGIYVLKAISKTGRLCGSQNVMVK